VVVLCHGALALEHLPMYLEAVSGKAPTPANHIQTNWGSTGNLRLS
jgi:hypothetical protein